MEQHIISTMMNETVSIAVRRNCARNLLSGGNSYIRSVAYWFLRCGHMSSYTKIWWEAQNS